MNLDQLLQSARDRVDRAPVPPSVGHLREMKGTKWDVPVTVAACLLIMGLVSSLSGGTPGTGISPLEQARIAKYVEGDSRES